MSGGAAPTAAPAARARRAGRADPLAGVVFALLAAACFGALFLTQRLKHTPTAVQEIRLAPAFAPTAAAGGPTEALSFQIAHDDAVTVTVINGSGNVVATLIAGHYQHRYRHLHLYWNGHVGPCAAPAATACASTLTGALAAPGSYRLRIALAEQQRTVSSPNAFRLRGSGGSGS